MIILSAASVFILGVLFVTGLVGAFLTGFESGRHAEWADLNDEWDLDGTEQEEEEPLVVNNVGA